jgi:hypothetical protein
MCEACSQSQKNPMNEINKLRRQIDRLANGFSARDPEWAYVYITRRVSDPGGPELLYEMVFDTDTGLVFYDPTNGWTDTFSTNHTEL